VERICYSFGGHSGDGSVSASGFFPHETVTRAVITALKLSNTYERKFLLVFIGSPF